MASKGQGVDSIESGLITTTQLTAPGITEWVEVYQYSIFTCYLTVASMVPAGSNYVRLVGTNDGGTTEFPIMQADPTAPTFADTTTYNADTDITIADNGDYMIITVTGKMTHIALRVVSENDAAATYDFSVMAGD